MLIHTRHIYTYIRHPSSHGMWQISLKIQESDGRVRSVWSDTFSLLPHPITCRGPTGQWGRSKEERHTLGTALSGSPEARKHRELERNRESDSRRGTCAASDWEP